MPISNLDALRPTPVLTPPQGRQRLARSLVLSRLRGFTEGTLRIRDAHGEEVLGGTAPGPEATVTVHDPVLWTDLLGGGVLGAGEAYVAGAWTADWGSAPVRCGGV